jgi:hypothetical protein
MKIRKIASVGIAGGILAGLVAVAAPANADPVAAGYSLVGSDTIQDIANALVNGTTVTGVGVRVVSGGLSIGSFNAFGSPTIQPHALSPFFTRPGGSGAGIQALTASINNTPYGGSIDASTGNSIGIGGLVDIARSSAGPSSGTGTSADLLTFVPFARDLVEYAYRVDATADPTCATALSALTKAQLTAIYSAATPTTIAGCATAITPRLPQSASGTRKFFDGAIGVNNTTPGAAVPANDNTPNGPQENTGGQINNYEIIPFSAASWIAQSTGAAPNTIGTLDPNLHLGAVNGVVAISGTGTAMQGVPAAFNDTTFGRDTYLVVKTSRITSGSSDYDAALAALVNPTANSGSLTTFAHTTAGQVGSVKLKFGFQQPSTTNVKYGNS